MCVGGFLKKMDEIKFICEIQFLVKLMNLNPTHRDALGYFIW